MNSITVSVTWLDVVLSTVLPIVVGLTFKAGASDTVKRGVALVAALLAALLTRWIDDGGVIELATLVTWAKLFAGQLAAYLGVWKDVEVAGQPVANLAPTLGLGPSRELSSH